MPDATQMLQLAALIYICVCLRTITSCVISMHKDAHKLKKAYEHHIETMNKMDKIAVSLSRVVNAMRDLRAKER